jgi:hypothetical protein
VPFTQTVNIGTQNKNWLDLSTTTTNSNFYYYQQQYYGFPTSGYLADWGGDPTQFNGGNSWQGCVMGRFTYNGDPTNPIYNYNLDDTPPSQSDPRTLFPAFNYPAYTEDFSGNCQYSYNCWATYNTGQTVYKRPFSQTTKGPNYTCPQPILPLTNDQNAIISAINALYPIGDTNIEQGMAWGWRTISPRWRGMWGNGNLPADYTTTIRTKVVILMTDGTNHWLPWPNFNAYGVLSDGNLYGYTYEPSAEQAMDDVTKNICYQLSQNNVFIYTIGFGTTDPNSTNYVNSDLLQYCATGNNPNVTGLQNRFFLAQSNTDLANDFNTIAQSLALLRVSQ